MEATSTADYLQAIAEAGAFVESRLGRAKIALVLGSGLGPFTDYLEDQQVLDFKEIPHMPHTAVAGHKGKLILGTVSGKRLLCLAGRTHAYEGYHMYQLTFMIRVMKRIGVELYITTNSSGGCQPGMTHGCIMAIRDHMNWFHRNPLYEVPELSETHVDARRIYSSRLIAAARRTAKAEHVQLFEGTSVTTCGPTYESFTEVSVGARWGASAFGMSLIPEAVVAYSEGLEVFGCSMITNIAAGIDDSSMKLTHEDVIGVGSEFAPSFTKFMLAFISQLETKAIKSLVLPSERIEPEHDKLPQLPAPVPTVEQIRAAADHVVVQVAKSLSLDLLTQRPEVAVYVSYGLENLAEHLRSSTKAISELIRIPYKDLPFFPCITRSGRRGELCIAKSVKGPTAPIIFLNGNALESFNCEEGVFVAQVLAHLGVEKLIHTFLAASNDPEIRADTVRIIGDAFDTTTIAPVAQVRGQPQYLSTRLFNTNASDLEDLILSFRFAGQEGTSKPVHYAHFLGPSFPTRAEANVALICKIPLVGITSLSLVYAARSVGMDVMGIAGISYEIGDDPLADASYVLWHKMRTVMEALFRSNVFPKHRSDRDTSVRLRHAHSDGDAGLLRRTQIAYHLSPPVHQGDPASVQESAQWLLSKGIPADADLAVVIDSRIPTLPWNLGGASTAFAYSDIPHFPPHASGIVTWITTAKGNKKLIILHGTVLFNEGRSNSEIGHSVRVLQALKARRIVFINEVASYSDVAPIHSLVLLRDHFNLSGRNPLFGKNVEEFGLRFPDLGNLYTDTLRTAVRRCAQQHDIGLTEVTAAFVVGPVFASLADAAVIQACESQVACTGMIPEVLVARHAQIPLAAIGVVKSCLVEGEQFQHSTKVKSSSQRALVRLIESLLERL